MKRLFFAGLILFIGITLKSQVFNTGQTLQKGVFLAGINPVMQGNDLGLYLHGGYGLSSGLDFGVRLGLGLGNYIGADIEYALISDKVAVSLAVGGHMAGDVGLDGTLNLTVPVTKSLRVYSGLDGDVNFGNNMALPIWVPVGMEVGIKKAVSVILEGDIAVTGDAGSIFGGGITFYF